MSAPEGWLENDLRELPQREETTVFEALSSRRRRLAVLFLARSAGPLSIGTLADLVTAVETGKRYRNADSDERKAVYVGLYQAHKDPLKEAGLVTIDDRDTTFIPTDRCIDEGERLADRLTADAPEVVAAVDRVLEEAGMAPWDRTVPDDVTLFRVPTGEQFKRLRKRAGLSQREIVDYLGVSQHTLSNFETGKSSPRAETLREAVEYIRRVTRLERGSE